MSIADPPLKITRSAIFNDDEKKMVTLIQQFDNGVTLKSKVPLCYGDDLESSLQTVIEFREVADELSFDTNAELFKQFRKCLKSTAREEWDLVKDPFIDNPLDNGFIQAQQEWILRYVPQDMFDVQKRYLERLRRPFDMEANIFAHRLQHLNLLLKEFPRTDEQEPLTVHQIKDVFFNAMPPKWQESFLLGNNNFTRHTLAELVKYMALAKGIADKQRANDSGRGGRFGRGRQDSRGGRGGRGGNRSTKRSQTGGYPKTAKRQDTDVCRIHGVDSSHTWYKCFGNPDGPNFKPEFIPRTDTNGRGQGRGRGRGRGNGQRGGRYSGFGRGRGPPNDGFYVQQYPPQYYHQSYAMQAPNAYAALPPIPAPAAATPSTTMVPYHGDNHWMNFMGPGGPR
jgi:hypothetical protein